MTNDKESISLKELDSIFDGELKAYLSLEKTVYELMTMYEQEPNDTIKEILLKVIKNAKEQVILLLGMISEHYRGELKNSYSNKLGSKLNELHDMEEKIVSPNKYR